jgi:hypothetical protein
VKGIASDGFNKGSGCLPSDYHWTALPLIADLVSEAWMHFVGLLDRSSNRMLYIIIGIGLIVGSCMWLKGLKDASSQSCVGMRA